MKWTSVLNMLNMTDIKEIPPFIDPSAVFLTFKDYFFTPRVQDHPKANVICSQKQFSRRTIIKSIIQGYKILPNYDDFVTSRSAILTH